MTHGKNICKQLKEVRKRIAEENEIPLKVEECTYKGECRGTCPRCEAEVRYLENALAERLRMGKVATVAGLVLGLAATAHAQSPTIPTNTRDSITNIEYLPSFQCTDVNAYKQDVNAYKQLEKIYGVTRGEGGSVTVIGGIRRRTYIMPPTAPIKDTLPTKFMKENGTPARQPISTKPPKMYQENEDDVKVTEQ